MQVDISEFRRQTDEIGEHLRKQAEQHGCLTVVGAAAAERPRPHP